MWSHLFMYTRFLVRSLFFGWFVYINRYISKEMAKKFMKNLLENFILMMESDYINLHSYMCAAHIEIQTLSEKGSEFI